MKITIYLMMFVFITGFSSCSSTDASVYFNKPPLPQCLTLVQEGESLGKMSCNGVIRDIPSALIIFEDSETVEAARAYYTKRETGHYICLRYRRKCSQ